MYAQIMYAGENIDVVGVSEAILQFCLIDTTTETISMLGTVSFSNSHFELIINHEWVITRLSSIKAFKFYSLCIRC